MKWFYCFALLLLILLNIYDTYSTTILLGIGATEINPVMNWLMNKIGIISALILLKIIFLYVFYEICLICFKKGITKREHIFLSSSFIISISIYTYIMLTISYPMMKMLE